jgi:hypothetical protein
MNQTGHTYELQEFWLILWVTTETVAGLMTSFAQMDVSWSSLTTGSLCMTSLVFCVTNVFSVLFDPVPPLRELRILYAQMDILLKQLKGSPSVASERPVPDVLFEKLSSPIVLVQFFQGTKVYGG